MICQECVYSTPLKQYIASNGFLKYCSYCGNSSLCVEDDELIEFMMGCVDGLFVSTDDLSSYQQTMIYECGSDDPHVFELSEYFEDYSPYAIDKFMEKFVYHFMESYSSAGNDSKLFVLNDGNLEDLNHFESQWPNFIESIGHELRFFNPYAKKYLDDLFDAITDGGVLDKKLTFTLGLDDSIFRARISYKKFDIDSISKDPINQLGPVPPYLASAQRMTPAGVVAFYGALDRETCISELRPMVGDAVVSAEFRPNQSFRLLDLNLLPTLNYPNDIFEKNFRTRSHASAFFKELVFQLSRPSSRDGHNDYLSTQVLFEYLRTRFGDEVHGIKYASVQKNGGGECVALFYEYSGVNDGFVKIEKQRFFGKSTSEATLFFMPESLKYHRIKSISYDGDVHDNQWALTMTDEVSRRLFPEWRY